VIWAADLFVVQSLTFKTLYVLLFITHGRRALVHLNVTAHPTAAWVWRQVVEATAWGKRPKHLIRDRDAVYGRDFRLRAKVLGIETVHTPVRSPRANAIAERVIGTLRRDCLDHVIPLSERHLWDTRTESCCAPGVFVEHTAEPVKADYRAGGRVALFIGYRRA
jgi:transposase InsO family protein